MVLKLLFLTATLHGLHKCRLHTDRTVALSDHFLKRFSQSLRHFKFVTCAAFDTKQLPKEVEAHQRQMARLLSKVASSTDSTSSPRVPDSSQPVHLPKPATKVFYNIDVYKLHSLGDYMHYVQHRGTMDSYSTQLVT